MIACDQTGLIEEQLDRRIVRKHLPIQIVHVPTDEDITHIKHDGIDFHSAFAPLRVRSFNQARGKLRDQRPNYEPSQLLLELDDRRHKLSLKLIKLIKLIKLGVETNVVNFCLKLGF
jgi:hypothetical protein